MKRSECVATLNPFFLSLRISLTFQRLFFRLQLTSTTHLKASELNAVWICYFWPFRNCCPSVLIQIVISWTDCAYGIGPDFGNQKFQTLFVTFFSGLRLEVRGSINCYVFVFIYFSTAWVLFMHSFTSLIKMSLWNACN